MPTITVPRTDVTSAEVVKALRDGLDSRYEVLPGMRIARSSFVGPRQAEPDAIVVAAGSGSVWRAQLTITRRANQTSIRVSPGGLLGIFVVNMFGIAREVRRVLLNAPGLGAG